MHLNDNLHICLLALMSRHPESIVDINEDILGQQSLGAGGWTVVDIIELFQRTPELLRAKARLVLDEQECSIYLMNQLEETPALYIHCAGKIPPCQRNMLTCKEKHEKRLMDDVSSSTPRMVTTNRR